MGKMMRRGQERRSGTATVEGKLPLDPEVFARLPRSSTEMSRVPSTVTGRNLGTSLYTVDADHIKAYAKATNDERPEYLDESRTGGIIAPPLFAVVAELPIFAELVSQLSLPLDRILHGEQDMTFVNAIRPGDALQTEAAIIDVSATSTGQTVTSEVVTSTQEGGPRVRSLFTQYVRDHSATRPSQMTEEIANPLAPAAQAEMLVRTNQPAIYAQSSGDYAAPHTDEDFAKFLGFRSVILQGSCTMAFASKAIVDCVCPHDPTRLSRLKVRFSNVVYPGDTLTTAIWGQRGAYRFETTNQDGVKVIKNGVAQVEP